MTGGSGSVILQGALTALLGGKLDKHLEYVAEDVRLQMAGRTLAVGRLQYAQWMSRWIGESNFAKATQVSMTEIERSGKADSFEVVLAFDEDRPQGLQTYHLASLFKVKGEQITEVTLVLPGTPNLQYHYQS